MDPNGQSDFFRRSDLRPSQPKGKTDSRSRAARGRSASFSNISPAQWRDWHWHVRNQITSAQELEPWLSLTVEEKRAVQFSQGRFQFGLTPYWASLMDPHDFYCPIRRQAIPLDEEFRTSVYEPMDFGPAAVRVAGGKLSHSFPDRAALFIHSRCVVYCRFCPQRKIQEAKPEAAAAESAPPDAGGISPQQWDQILTYLLMHPEIQEIILTGGEPLLLNDDLLHEIFIRLKSVPSIKTLRLQTRILSVLPQRITSSLAQMLKSFQPIYLILHVNHPYEITPEFSAACALLADSGVPLASETVLLHEINDRSQVLAELFSSLFEKRVRPYRLVQCVPSQGSDHFRTSVAIGLRLLESLKSRLGGMALPDYVVDTPGGKIPLRYESILSRSRKRILLKNFEGKVFVYPEKIFSFSS